mgnify:CR=1 FL=1
MFKIAENIEDGNNASIKTVEYFGNSYIVYDFVSYITTDENGYVFGWFAKPDLLFDGWDSGDRHQWLGVIKYDGDWQDSYLEV